MTYLPIMSVRTLGAVPACSCQQPPTVKARELLCLGDFCSETQHRGAATQYRGSSGFARNARTPPQSLECCFVLGPGVLTSGSAEAYRRGREKESTPPIVARKTPHALTLLRRPDVVESHQLGHLGCLLGVQLLDALARHHGRQLHGQPVDAARGAHVQQRRPRQPQPARGGAWRVSKVAVQEVYRGGFQPPHTI